MIKDRYDKRLFKFGFEKVVDHENIIGYEYSNDDFNYVHCIDIVYKANGNHLIQSYQKDVNSEGFSNMIGIPYKISKLIYKKLKKYIPRYEKYKTERSA